jgi:3-keto-5-aminohexanoate cleavage enzyme
VKVAHPNRPVVIGVAPNGARKGKQDLPNLPIQPDELIESALECLEAGAAYFHFHLRGTSAQHLLDAKTCGKVLQQLRNAVGDRMLLQVTTESAGLYSPQEQMAFVDALDPAPISVAIREFLPVTEPAFAAFLHRAASRGFWIQYIIYTVDELKHLTRLQADGIVPQVRPAVLFVLGSYLEQRSGKPMDLIPFVQHVIAGWSWSVCSFGSLEHQCTMTAAALGGHIRVGFENNALLANGARAAKNSTLIQQAVDGLRHLSLQAADNAAAGPVIGKPE